MHCLTHVCVERARACGVGDRPVVPAVSSRAFIKSCIGNKCIQKSFMTESVRVEWRMKRGVWGLLPEALIGDSGPVKGRKPSVGVASSVIRLLLSWPRGIPVSSHIRHREPATEKYDQFLGGNGFTVSVIRLLLSCRVQETFRIGTVLDIFSLPYTIYFARRPFKGFPVKILDFLT